MTNAPSFPPTPGLPYELMPGLSLILAPNPSPMTHMGTNTYVLGTTSLAIIDPGPDDPQHLAALLTAIEDRPVTHIFVTHSHLDHSPLAKQLSTATGARICAFGDSSSGRSTVMQRLSDAGLSGGGEGVDLSFLPDLCLEDGAVIAGSGWQINALHTPGHMGNHMCYRWNDIVFTGDHVMGWASTMVSPPDGDVGDFMRSCDKLMLIEANTFLPGHGAPILSPKTRLEWLTAHRQERERQVLSALTNTGQSIKVLTNRIYSDVAPALLSAAARNVFAHLINLHEKGLVTASPALGIEAAFARAR